MDVTGRVTANGTAPGYQESTEKPGEIRAFKASAFYPRHNGQDYILARIRGANEAQECILKRGRVHNQYTLSTNAGPSGRVERGVPLEMRGKRTFRVRNGHADQLEHVSHRTKIISILRPLSRIGHIGPAKRGQWRPMTEEQMKQIRDALAEAHCLDEDIAFLPSLTRGGRWGLGQSAGDAVAEISGAQIPGLFSTNCNDWKQGGIKISPTYNDQDDVAFRASLAKSSGDPIPKCFCKTGRSDRVPIS